MITTTSLWDLFVYLRGNAWRMIFVLALGAYTKAKVLDPKIKSYQQQKSYNEATNPTRVSKLEKDMRRIREKQQEMAHQNAMEAKVQRELKRVEELKKSQTSKKKTGYKLGDGNDKQKSRMRSEHNPLMPGSSHMPSYRPARRSVNRGG